MSFSELSWTSELRTPADSVLSFVIFHEIGHCALDHQLSRTNDRDVLDTFNIELESQADQFALEQYGILIDNPVAHLPYLQTTDCNSIPWLYFRLLNAINFRSNRLYGANSYIFAYISFDRRATTVQSLITDNTTLTDKP